MGLRWTVAVLTVAALGAPASSSAITRCSLQGPAWTVYPAHSNTAHHGSTYRVIATRVSCATAKGYVKRLFAKNPSWPYAGRPGTMKLKGAPSGYTCRSVVESKRNRKEYAGDCLFPGTGPSDFKQFSWAPKLPPL